MPGAWIVTTASPEWVEAFREAGWEVEAFAPPDLVPAPQSQVREPDVIVFEVSEGRFFDTFKEICRDKLAPVLAIVPNWTFADQVFEAGADDVIAVPVHLVELLARARRLADAGKVIRAGELRIDLFAQTVELSDRLIQLSPGEFRLLACLARHIGQAISHDGILQDAFGQLPELGGALEQVKSCVKRVRQKIEPDPHHPQYVITIRRVGYQLRNQAQWEAAVGSS